MCRLFCGLLNGGSRIRIRKDPLQCCPLGRIQLIQEINDEITDLIRCVGNILTDANGNLRYDYGNGDNVGMERSLFPNGNALSDSRLNKSESEGNAFNGTG